MLTREENELLCRVGPETPMGQMLRRYWLPALLSSELPEPDGAPKRVRLLGEDLVAFRDSQGQVGLLDEYCPHRGASLVLARNENCALTCIYHGWQIAADGTILDTPAEPEESDFRTRVKALSYPVQEAGGMVWAYLGPPNTAPQFPAWEWTALPLDHVSIIKVQNQCNWLQALEGVLDSAHISFLHSSEIRPSNDQATITQVYRSVPSADTRPRLEVEDTTYGFWYGAIRKSLDDPEGARYVRTSHFVAPFWGLFPAPAGWGHMQAFVPVDDMHATFYYVQYNLEGPADREPLIRRAGTRPGVDLDAEFRSLRRRENTWLQDRAAMRRGSFSGIEGVNQQDFAVQESMGPIYDRRKEHLGTSDIAVIRMRRIMLDAVQRFQQGGAPVGLDGTPVPYARLRAAEGLIAATTPWQAAGALAPAPARV